MERLIEASGAEWTFLRPTGFAANTLMWADQAITQAEQVRIIGEAMGREVRWEELALVHGAVVTPSSVVRDGQRPVHAAVPLACGRRPESCRGAVAGQSLGVEMARIVVFATARPPVA